MSKSTALSPLGQAAVKYAHAGWPVFPCQPRGKTPMVKTGFKAATHDADLIREWWSKWPLANVGIPTGAASGIAVLDIDPGGDDSLVALTTRHGPLPETREVKTGRGRQSWFKHPSVSIRCNAGALGKGLDWRADGGYVVAPPSIHPNGSVYKFLNDQPTADLPTWLMDLLTKSKTQANSTRDDGAKITEGRRNAHLTSLAGSMQRRGTYQEAILAALMTENERGCDPPLPEAEVRKIVNSVNRYEPARKPNEPTGGSIWDAAAYVSEEEENESVEFLETPILARGHLTEVAGPRGIGKSNYALSLGVKVGRAGKRVLYLDRDNPPRKARQNVRAWGGAGIVKLLTRDKIPALLGNEAEWKAFPTQSYDLVVLDSWDSTAEGIGEKDSRLPSIAISRLLDIVHAEDGPAVLVLMNTVRDNTHSRCSGVVEDRADAIFEVRDMTDVQSSGRKPWHEEIPILGARDWAVRATRRKGKERYRLGLVGSKWKIDGPKPSPFAVEVDFTTSPYSVRDVTDQVDAEGAEARRRRAAETAEAIRNATDMLRAEIQRRSQAGEPDLLKKKAEDFLTKGGVTQKIAREAVKAPIFELVEIPGPGHPKAVRVGSKILVSNRNTVIMEEAKKQAMNVGDFGCRVSMHPTEIGHSCTSINTGEKKGDISVDDSLFSPPSGAKKEPLEGPAKQEGDVLEM